MDDVSIIREILAVTHVPVVAQLQWEKLQSLLRSVCDRITAHTARLEKAEELAKSFQAFKDEIYEVCETTAQECKDFTEIEIQKQTEKLEVLAKSTEDRIETVQHGVDENAMNIRTVTEEVTAVKSTVEPLPKRLEEVENGVKGLNETSNQLREKVAEQGAELEKQSKAFQSQFDEHVMETTGAIRVLTEEIEGLQADVLDHSDRLMKVENQGDDLKIQLQQTAQNHAAELDALNKYCQGLRTDLDTKLVAPPELKPGQRRPSAIMTDLGNAVTDIQSRLQSKADLTAIEHLTQTNKDSLQRVTQMIEDLRQQQQRRTSSVVQPPSRRSSKLSSLLQNGGTKGMVTDYVADEVRESLKTHDQRFSEIHRDMSFLGRTVLIMSGHDDRYVTAEPPVEAQVPAPAAPAAPSAAGAPVAPPAPAPATAAAAAAPVPVAAAATPPPENSAAAYEEMFFAFEKALREQKIQPKEDLVQMKQLQAQLEGMRETKAEKKDMQKIARIVREFMEQPEHAVFSGKPLMGFKCMSCDQDISKLNPLRADYLPHGAMPKQVLPMMSAERLFSPNGGSPRTPRLSHRGNRRSISAGNPNRLSKPL